MIGENYRMALEQFLKTDLVKLNLEVSDRDSFFDHMFNEAFNKGYVEEMFLTKIKDRESVFPTGLKMADYSVAIPHTDPQYVKEQFIAVATLKEPVKFNLMDDASQETDVKVIFMLGLNQPHSQIEALQQLMQMIQSKENIEKLLTAKDFSDVQAVFSQLGVQA